MSGVDKDNFLRYTLDREMLKKLYLVLAVGGNQHPENLEVVMWLSNPIEEDLLPNEIYEDAYFLKLHKHTVDEIVKWAQKVQYQGDLEGGTLSAAVRSSLVPGKLRYK